MPDDLLRHVIGPTPYSSWWLWVAVLLLVVLIVWYAGVFVLTMPADGCATCPSSERRAASWSGAASPGRCVEIGERYRAGDLAAAPAGGGGQPRTCAASCTQATGVRAEYMQVEHIAASELASAAPLLAQLNDAQFNAASRVDVGRGQRIRRGADPIVDLTWWVVAIAGCVGSGGLHRGRAAATDGRRTQAAAAAGQRRHG